VRRMAAVAPIIGVLIFASVATAVAQRRGGFGGGGGRFAQIPIVPNAPYDGRFTFVRVRYGPDYGFASQRLPWSHDYPAGEQHFMKIINELSLLAPRTSETNILTFDDPQLFKYPVAYLCEPGGWTLSDQEAASLRTYLQKGGFMIVDDFRYQHWGNFESQIMRVLPEARIYDMTLEDPIFHAFFEIRTLDVPQYYDPPPAIFRAIYENNDPTKRILVMINYNTDISEYWEWSDTGLKPIDESNEAYKLGVNYVIYGMTH
jgi:uncharacterized protein DUF4159